MATAVEPVAGRPSVAGSSVGRKIAMAVSGAVLIGFVIGHFLGNLKIFLGREVFNHYAEGLRTMGEPFFARGQLLWIIRIILIIAVVMHVVLATQLTLESRRARPVRYGKYDSLVFHYASRTMVWGGITILAFVVFHLMHLTFGTIHPDFVAGDAYHNFVAGFRVLPVSVAYMVAMIPLAFHLYHGTWSAFQTLGANNERYNRYRRPFALAVALIVAGGNVIFPIAVLSGLVR